MELSNIIKLQGNKRKNKRVGRGIGSGKGGHTTGRGNKGQNSREGHKFSLGFEGGQVPLFKKLPKLGGFRNPTKKRFTAINLSKFNSFEAGDKVTPELLLEKGVIDYIQKDGVKVLGSGKLSKKLKFSGFTFSKSALEVIKKSGSSVNE